MFASCVCDHQRALTKWEVVDQWACSNSPRGGIYSAVDVSEVQRLTMNCYSRCEWFPTTDNITYDTRMQHSDMQLWDSNITTPGYHSTLGSVSETDFEGTNQTYSLPPSRTGEQRQG